MDTSLLMDQRKVEAYRLLVTEQSLEVRARREPEHIYTAALLGALGALAWGVATVAAIPDMQGAPFFRNPAIMGAATVALMSFFVYLKIKREHRIYVSLRKQQNSIIGKLAELSGLDNIDLPAGLQSDFDTNGPGYKGARNIITASSFGVFIFCISIWMLAADTKPVARIMTPPVCAE